MTSLSNPTDTIGTSGLLVFGGPILLRDGKRLRLSPLQSALLGAIGLAGESGIHRRVLLSILWREGTESKLRRRLNQLVYSIHKRHPKVRIRRSQQALYALAGVRTDLERFTELLQLGKIQSAGHLLASEPLSGLPQAPTIEMEQWIQKHRCEIHSAFRRRARAVYQRASETSDWTTAKNAAAALLRLRPWDERVLRQLMRATALGGRPEQALEAFSEFREHLSDPAWTPEKETAEFVTRLKHFRGGAIAPTTARQTMSLDRLIGREAELGRIASAIRTAPPEQVSVYSISGEDGLGKSRLLDEIVQRFALEGYRTRSGRCVEAEVGIPFASVAGIFPPEVLQRRTGWLPETWEPILRGLAGPRSGIVNPMLTEHASSWRWWSLFPSLLEALHGEGPLILALDDLHWIDHWSLGFLSLLGRCWDRGTLLLVTSSCARQLTERSEVSRWLRSVRSNTQLRLELSLTRLCRDDTRNLVEEILSDEDGRLACAPRNVEALVQLVDGRPSLVRELDRAWVARGPRPPADTQHHRLGDLLIQRRLERVSPTTRESLFLLSIADRPLSTSCLASALHVHRKKLAEVIDEAVEERLMEFGARGCSLMIPESREWLRAALDAGTLASLHGRLADALAASSSGGSAQLANHLLKAGERNRAWGHVLPGARGLISDGAWDEAISLLELSLRARPPGELAGSIASLLGEGLMLRGEFRRAEAAWGLAARAFREAGNLEPALKCEIGAVTAESLRPNGAPSAIGKKLAAIEQEARDLALSAVVAACMDATVRVFDSLRELDQVRSLTNEARDAIGSHDEEADLGFLLVSMVDAVYGNNEDTPKVADNAIAIALRRRDATTALRALNWKVISYHHMGTLNTDAGRGLVSEAVKLSEGVHDVRELFRLHANLGVWHLEAGEYDSARRAFERASQFLSRLSIPQLRRNLAVNMGQLELETGDLGSAATAFESAMESALVADYKPLRWVATAGLGLTSLMEGRLGRARRLRDGLPELPARWTFDPILWLTLDARLTAIGGSPTEASSQLHRQRTALRNRFKMSWLRLTLLRLNIRRRAGLAFCDDDIREASSFLRQRQLTQRYREFQRIVAGPS